MNLRLLVPLALALLLPTPGRCTDASSSPAAQAGAMAHQHAGDAPVASPAARRAVPPGSEQGGEVTYGSLDGEALKGYFARPTAAGVHPGLILFHEWWGLNDNIRSMAEQFAAQGYDALAVDLYHGHSATTPDQARQLMQSALSEMPWIDRNIEAAYAYLQTPAGGGTAPRRIGTVGWCFGGGMSFEAGQVLSGKLSATVIYYGFVNDRPEALAKLKAPVLGLFGGRDTGIPQSLVEGFKKGLEAQGAHPVIHVYPDAGHAFANPSGRNYVARDADDAWKRTLAFLKRTL